MLCTLVPYRRTLCIADNMVVLNDKYMRDNIDMTSFEFGGKIKVLGYITNKITTDATESSNISPLAQVGIGLNQIMLSFFGQQSCSFFRKSVLFYLARGTSHSRIFEGGYIAPGKFLILGGQQFGGHTP